MGISRWGRHWGAIAAICALMWTVSARASDPHTFDPGSLIIPMDLAYQDSGTFQAYGLVYHLLREGITVYWVIDPDKEWHDDPCDTAGNECAWDCKDEGSGIKCDYPTASPDFYTEAEVVWDGEGQADAGDAIAEHGYRGGPFLVDFTQAGAALDIIDAWNDTDLWPTNTWAERTIFAVVTVHLTTVGFTGLVEREMVAAPTIAVFADGKEDVATAYLRAAGIPQSNGMEFPPDKCGENDCGPGTDNPDMLTVPSLMGEMGTCGNQNYDHKNGALFTDTGLPAYCQIMSMHWDVGDRNTVECDGGDCPGDPADCAGEIITYHGHEVVAEVRQFLEYPTHFFAECQGVNAYENTVPNADWPFQDDADRKGHFLTTEGYPPDCGPGNECTDDDFECIEGGCDNGTRDCCIPKNEKEVGAGFLIADQPNSEDIQILFPEIPYNQFDGYFDTTGGSEPAYNLSTYLGTTYINNQDVTFITGPNGPGDQDIWMTGYMDGTYAMGDNPDIAPIGKISYLGGHSYDTDLPLSDHWGSQGTRLFLNALFEADCVTTAGQPEFELDLVGDNPLLVQAFPVERTYDVTFTNNGTGSALTSVLSLNVPANAPVLDAEPDVTQDGELWSWELGDVGSVYAHPGDPDFEGQRYVTVEFSEQGDYEFTLGMAYVVGLNEHTATPQPVVVQVQLDTDGDGVPDDDDPYPEDADSCGDSDGDGCDDCSEGHGYDPANDGPDADGDGMCGDEEEEEDNDDTEEPGDCDCTVAPGGTSPVVGLLALLLVAVIYRRTKEATGR